MAIDAAQYREIVVLTGAGVSVASGLPTYRGQGGLWEDAELATYATADALAADPAGVWRGFGGLRASLLKAAPNDAHIALARFEANLRPDQNFTLVTQNVDGLHQQAGSTNVLEIHGTLRRTRCTAPDCSLEPFDDDEAYDGLLPLCPECSQPLRPDIVLFGEYLPVDATHRTKQALRDCDLFLAIGTSGTVMPASSFVRSAQLNGARTMIVNLDPIDTPSSPFEEEYLGRAEELLPRLLGTSVEG